MTQQIVIVGGGTAGWMTAAALLKTFENCDISITLIESETIGTIGVGEATIPHLRYFNQRLGISEVDFMKATQATFKLGIEFVNWKNQNSSYLHPFSCFGTDISDEPFHLIWQDANKQGLDVPLDHYSLAAMSAKQGRFTYPQKTANPLSSSFSYAFHIDAVKYAAFLSEWCKTHFNGNQNCIQFEHITETVENVNKDLSDGSIQNVQLTSGRVVEGSLFVDCTGFASLLYNKTLGGEYESWSKYLPCDRALAAPSEEIKSDRPYTVAKAHASGWSWKIPLHNRSGNGVVYASDFTTDDSVAEILLQDQLGHFKALTTPQLIKFEAKKARQCWLKNTITIGLSAGFLEPLESTSIYLIQSSISHLIELIPEQLTEISDSAKEFNHRMDNEYNKIRDFIILHYHITQREDSEFWRYMKNLDIPDTLKERIEVFKESGHITNYRHGLFLEPSWACVMLCQGLESNYTSTTLSHSNRDMMEEMRVFSKEIERMAKKLPSHESIIKKINSGNENLTPPNAAMNLYGVFS